MLGLESGSQNCYQKIQGPEYQQGMVFRAARKMKYSEEDNGKRKESQHMICEGNFLTYISCIRANSTKQTVPIATAPFSGLQTDHEPNRK